MDNVWIKFGLDCSSFQMIDLWSVDRSATDHVGLELPRRMYVFGASIG